jgi:septin family protein
VQVDKVRDADFQQFYNAVRHQRKSDKFYFMFMGMTGTGKTTMVEYFLNVLTGQVHTSQALRAKDIEAGGKAGDSQTVNVCRYEIEYIYKGAWMFCIVLIDTPGFADVGGLEKDKKHVQNILTVVSKIEYLNGIHYVVGGNLTRKTLEPLKVMCNIFSIMPTDAFQCVSTMISFCDNMNQAANVISVLDEMLKGIQNQPSLFLDNPWYGVCASSFAKNNHSI